MDFIKKLICFLATIIFYSSILAATLESMTPAQVRNAFIHKTLISIPTDNLNGKTIHNIFCMYMDEQGNIYGKMSHKPINQPQIDKGVYTIEKDGTVTITWNHWDQKKKLYAEFYETKNAYLAIGRDNIFHTVFMKESVLSGDKLDLSSVIKQ